MNRRYFLALGLTLSGALLTSCDKNKPADSPKPTPGTGKGTKKLKAGLVTDTGGVGDKSFNAQAWTGLQAAQKELGAEVKYVESKQNADYVANLTKFAKAKYDVIFAVGFLMQDALREVAGNYPKIKFAIIDGDAPALSNCVAYKFREQEGSFLAGALAASMSKTGVLGFIGGMEMPLIKKFEYGYQAGAYAIKPEIQTRVAYVGDFNDSQKGMELALSQMSGQADIIYHAAGKAGIGVIKAAQTKGEGFYAIGVDKDQDDEAPGRVLTSMVKRVDVAVLEVCKKVAAGRFESGEVVLGLKEGGVGLSEMKNTKSKIPAEVLKKIEELKQQIIDGKLHPPYDASGFLDFTKPAS
ncbi:BMP family protein [Armatimonas sp.]|uniref:BMP family lipoprotein n=1 Tax=Armatimonas sp. TaxID=1872638 RepID=UPI00374D1C47